MTDESEAILIYMGPQQVGYLAPIQTFKIFQTRVTLDSIFAERMCLRKIGLCLRLTTRNWNYESLLSFRKTQFFSRHIVMVQISTKKSRYYSGINRRMKSPNTKDI